jgi:hypothetical protein
MELQMNIPAEGDVLPGSAIRAWDKDRLINVDNDVLGNGAGAEAWRRDRRTIWRESLVRAAGNE